MRPGNFGYGIRYVCKTCGNTGERHKGEVPPICIWDQTPMQVNYDERVKVPVKRVELL